MSRPRQELSAAAAGSMLRLPLRGKRVLTGLVLGGMLGWLAQLGLSELRGPEPTPELGEPDASFLQAPPSEAAAAAQAPTGQTGDDYRLERAALLSRTLNLVDSRYLETPSLKVPDLFEAGLEGLVRQAADCLWVPPTTDRPGALLVGSRVVLLDPQAIQSFEALVNTFSRIFSFYLQARELTVEDIQIEYAVIRGILSRMDKPTVLMVGSRLDDFKVRSRGTLSGIGCTIGIRNDRPTVLKITEDSPSEAAGLKSGDVIVRIDGESTVNMSTSDVVSRIRGMSGTWVSLSLQRDGAGLLQVRIMRDKVRIENVEVAGLDDGIAYVRITNFNDETLSNFRTRLAKLAPGWKGIKGMVIDLRGNSGGSLKQSAYMVDEFISEGKIVRTEGRSSQVVKDLVKEIEARPPQLIPDLPLVVLVDNKTASGAEILAGALKYLDRAVLIGQRTYGKGSVQQEYPLNRDASVKMTVARYLLPGDHFIHAVGIEPDVRVIPVESHSDRIRFLFPENQRDDDDEESGEIHGSEELPTPPRLELFFRKPLDEPPEGLEERLSTDFEVQLAWGLLKQVGVARSSATLTAGIPWLMEQKLKQEGELRTLFQEHRIDWEAPPGAAQAEDEPPGGAAGPTGSSAGLGGPEPGSVHSTPHSSQNSTEKATDKARIEATLAPHVRFEPEGPALQAGSDSALVLEITNQTDAPLFRVRGVAESAERLLNGLQFYFGKLEPGETRRWKVPLTLPAGAAAGVRPLKVRFSAGGRSLPPFETGVAIRAGQEPALELQLSYRDSLPGGPGAAPGTSFSSTAGGSTGLSGGESSSPRADAGSATSPAAGGGSSTSAASASSPGPVGSPGTVSSPGSASAVSGGGSSTLGGGDASPLETLPVVHPGDRVVEPGEEVRLQVSLKNMGSGPTGELLLTLRHPARKELELKDARLTLEPLQPGEEREATLSFLLKPQAPGDAGGQGSEEPRPIQLTLLIQDKAFFTRIERELDFTVPWSGRLALTPPRLSLLTPVPMGEVEAGTLAIAGRVAGPHGIKQVTIFRGRTKLQRFLPGIRAQAPVTNFPFETRIPVVPGTNRLEVVTEDELGLKTSRMLWLRAISSSNP